MSQILWQPSEERIANARITQFARRIGHSASPPDYKSLHKFSLNEPERFWDEIWEFGDVAAVRKGDRILLDGKLMPGARFFPDARLNFAENILRGPDARDAIIFQPEIGGAQIWTMGDLKGFVSKFRQGLIAAGVGTGDRVAGIMPNLPETMGAMLATASLGAIWSSASPDFGVQGILDRFGQIEPKVVVACAGYSYAGKPLDTSAKVAAVVDSIASVKQSVIVPYTGNANQAASRIPNAITLDAFLEPYPTGAIQFAQMPFDHPLYILFSSGTTGVPKCIVHSAGGILLKHLEEHQLQSDIHAGDRLFYFTTCGWMMWNWLVSAPASGATVVLYDGSPFHPGPERLFDLIADHEVTHFGTSAKYIDAVRKSGYRPADHHDFPKLRALFSTGSPLAPNGFDFVYENVKPDIHLASISGGTDICGCFVGGNPVGSVHRGEIQAPFLGMAVDVFDENGHSIRPGGGKGELVCEAPFPSMPVRFWADSEGARYRNAYFDRFEGIWCHGDFAEPTETGGIIIHGRSDATLNPGGVRIGTAEIYTQVEALDDVREAIAIGQDWDGDTRIVLFVVMSTEGSLDDAAVNRIKSAVRNGASPRHVPAVVIEVPDIPRTKSGKITELAVREIVHGRPVKNQDALGNPLVLEHFRNLPQLST